MKIFISALVLVLLGSFVYLKLTRVTNEIPITVPGNHSKQDVQIIKQAFRDLASICPAVMNGSIETISATREINLDKEPARAWQNIDYSWTEQVYITVKSLQSHRRYSGHTHHFYVATGGHKGVVIDGKQESIEFCGIKAKMKDHLFISVQ